MILSPKNPYKILLSRNAVTINSCISIQYIVLLESSKRANMRQRMERLFSKFTASCGDM